MADKSSDFEFDPNANPEKTLARAKKFLAAGKLTKKDFGVIERRVERVRELKLMGAAPGRKAP